MPPTTRNVLRRRTLRQILGGVRRRARRAVGAVRRAWRRSLQLQVVTSTLVISVTVVVVLGVFLSDQINKSVIASSQASAASEAFADRVQIAAALSLEPDDQAKPADAGKSAPADPLDAVMNTITGSGENGSKKRYEVLVLNTATPGASRASGKVSPRDVPLALRQGLERQAKNLRYDKPLRHQALIRFSGETQPRLTLVIGGLIPPDAGASYEVYHFFPLNDEEQMLSNVRLAIVVVGFGLVLLLAAIAYLVARQVVTPVRLARQAAERLAAGKLDERLKVRGEDDLARLATSFNEMAGNLALKIHQLEELSQVQRQFVSDVSHELRTPLTTVRMAADLLYDAREDFEPMAARSAELMQAQLERFESMLADLLEISRYDAGAATLDLDSVDVRDVVLRAIADSEALAERHSTRFELRLPNEPCMAEIDNRRVERILRNLLFNAIEHGEGRDVVVTVGADRDAVAVAVRDHGIGLKAGEETMVFDRFWRADPSRARTIGGTGLGLAISREDATLHGGWLQAWGQAGEGSQFRLTLPRTAGADLKGSPLSLVPPEIEMRRTWRGQMTPVLLPASGDGAGHEEL
ncbi:two-component system sensor histidine kinase MtrB [Nonomuraea roseoviolacea subsp. roseoviolacea]|uniref:Sensor histidine kinase MtrB n=1 Tax=Nonomuraea roseoviolacea subsp. carminata TaxID=160689 RepID=A0ABT1JVM1_9ACTN|nr:MtrAB system histidine kinase MtrB [Nonomuraea roseoviolacea]MCP2345818.1 two-component system sensor histidine kinase MtrB [Nonomuraea roseoviolacea subsp. carminata]